METRIGFAMCGSFCTYERVIGALKMLREQYDHIQPILSESSFVTDTRFGSAADFRAQIEEICGVPVWHSIVQTEPVGPKKLLDLLVVAPCTGNTLAKLSAGIADTCVTMAVKSQLRNERPVVLAVSTNDGLFTAARNIGDLLTRRHCYFVPFGQDDPIRKPRSLVARMEQIPATVAAALRGEQLQPILCAAEQ